MDENSDQDLKTFDNLISYSKDVTKFLFGGQSFAHADSQNLVDLRTRKRREFIKNIKINDQMGNLLNKINKPSHPLVRTVDPRKQVQMKAPNLSVVLRDTSSMTDAQIITNKSARDLVTPWMNSIDRKAVAMHDMVQPDWHPPWKLYRMISGHGGWVHSLSVDPANMWFASGCRDGLIKIWDLASGKLRLTLTGHISGVRGLAISARHPYLFSCGDDKMVKCWDLEQNQVVRHYHGHLSGVYCLSLHPTENILITGGRDSAVRVWDMRTKEQIHCLTGHRDTIGSILCQPDTPQLISGSYDTTIRLWDLKMARSTHTLTHHKKSVRTLAMNHDKKSFVSGAIDNIKQWSYPRGEFLQNLSGHTSIINSLAVNKKNVLVSGADNGTLFFWDWRTGHNFQRMASPPQRGSIESEAGILATAFDRSGTRLITGETDKTIKMYREDTNATEETHPRPAPRRMILFKRL